MAYYVLGEYGQKYGPADVAILNLWISEGRIAPATMLEDESSGSQVVASAVKGLQFVVMPNPALGNQAPYQAPQYPQQPYQSQPYQQPYQTQPYQPQAPIGAGSYASDAQFRRARSLCLVSLVLTLIFPIAGFAAAIASIINAVMAKDSGHPNSRAGMLYGGGAILFCVLMELFRMGGIFLR